MPQQIQTTTVLVSQRALALWEIASVLISCFIAEWVVLSLFGRNRWLVAVPISFAFVLMIASHRSYGEGFRQMGFRLDNFVTAVRVLILPTLVAVIVILVVGWLMRDGHSSTQLLRPRFLLTPLWALFQQYALQGYINRRAQIVFGKGAQSVLLVALLFTLVGGLVWAAVYQRHPNLFALAASHTIASITVALALPPDVINSLRVGFKYFG